MKQYTGQPGLVPGIGKLKPGNKIDETKLSPKQLEGLKGKLKVIKKEVTK